MAAKAQTESLESRVASTARETPAARGHEGKVIPFPARRDDEPVESAGPDASALVAAAADAPGAPTSAAPNTPPMPHVLASQRATQAEPSGDPERYVASAEPTVREPVLERRREREERQLGNQTLSLGSGLPPEVTAVSPAAAPPPATGGLSEATPRHASNGAQMLDMSLPVAAAPGGPSTTKSHADVEKLATRSPHEPVHEGLHDEFFDAGEQGLYDGGHGAERHHALDEDLDLDHDAPRVVVRTPEQEMRRNRMMRVVGVVVGVVLGVLVFAVLRGRGTSPEERRPGAGARADEQPVAPPVEPAPPAVVSPPPPPPPPPERAAQPPEPEVTTPPPAEKPATGKPIDRPAPVARPDGALPTPRPAVPPAQPKPAPVQPRPAAPPPAAAPADKPPTASFPD